jgi:hypothetical protein
VPRDLPLNGARYTGPVVQSPVDNRRFHVKQLLGSGSASIQSPMTKLSGIASIDSQLPARVGLTCRIRRISNQDTAKKSNIFAGDSDGCLCQVPRSSSEVCILEV